MGFRSIVVSRSYEQVAEQLLERIHAGDFLPNQRLPTERELGDLFGVSRGVIREAIKVLITLGVVESRQGSGTYVSANLAPSVSRALVLSARPDEASLVSLMEFRAPLERLAAELATSRRSEAEVEIIHAAAEATAAAADPEDWVGFGIADHRFHITIAKASRNPFLATVLNAARDVQDTAVRLLVAATGSIAIASDHHRRIAEAIRVRDPETAVRIMGEHVAYSSGALQKALTMPASDRARLDLRWGAAVARIAELKKVEELPSSHEQPDEATDAAAMNIFRQAQGVDE